MRLFGKKQERAAEVVEAPPCLHVAMTARWDSVADMGDESKATSFFCTTCNSEFTPQEAAAIRESQAEQIRRDLSQA